jgi:hypothetical protein
MDSRLKAVHDKGQRRHQLLALLGHVGRKHRFHLRRDLEQAVIEQHRRGFRDRRDLGETLLNQFDLVWCHFFPPGSATFSSPPRLRPLAGRG